jgi:hypothetical protein
MLLTEARYQAITGDRATNQVAFTAAVELAVERLEDALDRGLAEEERLEDMWPDRGGWLWPRCTPITVCADYTIDGDGLIGTFGPSWPDQTGKVAVTYTGGWVERSANPSAANRLPTYIEDDLAWATWALLHPDASAARYPAGATSVRLGDASVSFGPDGAPRPGTGIKWCRRTLSHRARTVGSAGDRRRGSGFPP